MIARFVGLARVRPAVLDFIGWPLAPVGLSQEVTNFPADLLIADLAKQEFMLGGGQVDQDLLYISGH